MIVHNRIVLREKRMSDARDDYSWESDPELAQLDAAPPVDIPFRQYLSDYTHELNIFYHTSQRFGVDTLDGKHIGNSSLYNINETNGEAELGIMLGNRDYWNKGYGTDVVNTLVDYAFQETKLQRVYLKTLESNKRAQKCFQKCGFNACGRLARDGYHFSLMEIHRYEWEERQKQLKDDN